MEGGRRREGSRTTREKPPRPCDGGREGCEAKSGRIGWPERVAAKVVAKGDPRVAGRREPEEEEEKEKEEEVEGHLAGNASVRRHAKYRRPRDAGRQYTTPN